MNYLLSDIAAIAGGWLHGEDHTINHIYTDSRRTEALDREGSLFFALHGPKRQGHTFIADLVAQGFRYFLTDHMPTVAGRVSYILVEDPLKALQQLAAHHRGQFRFPVIGITGSNGKTICKEWLWQLLKNDFRMVRSPGSYNSQLGVPLSVLQCDPSHQLGIFEAGISQTGEMELLESIIRPDLVILNHIGPAHDEGFPDRETKIREKLLLATHADYLIYNADDPGTAALVKEFVASHYIKTLSYSFKQPSGIYIHQTKREADRTVIQFIYKSGSHSISIPFTDDASVENAVSCLAALIALERLDPEHMSAFMQLQPVSGRLEQIKGMNDCILVNDSYNSDLHSLRSALSFLKHQNPALNKTVILSDMEEIGIPSAALYTQISALLEASDISKFIGIGPEIYKHQQLFSKIGETAFYENTEAYMGQLSVRDFHHEIILIKGARKFRFEDITELLRKQNHRTRLEINLSAVTHNLNIYKSLLPKNTRLMVMVKAFSYGSGSYELAGLLQHLGVDYLAVAYPDEGMQLREAGIQLPIMVMNADPESARMMHDYQLEPVIYGERQLQLFLMASRNFANPLKVHLEFETGMNRLGITADQLDAVLDLIQKNSSNISVLSAFTHLSATDDPNDDTFTASQLKLYKDLFQKTCLTLRYKILSHIANSAGISRFNGFECDMARLGLGLHGIDPSGVIQERLLPVSSLKTVISQIRTIPQGASVSYNRTFIAAREMRLGVVGIGYADGLRRELSNGKGGVYIQNIFCPFIGRICMDMSMVDLGTLEVKEGDEVVIFENARQIQEIARICDTIPYEILTGISERITRIYIQNS